jgi:hypothetical protein
MPNHHTALVAALDRVSQGFWQLGWLDSQLPPPMVERRVDGDGDDGDGHQRVPGGVSPRVPPESPTSILRRVSNFHSIVVQIRPFQVTSGKAGSGRAVKDAAA